MGIVTDDRTPLYFDDDLFRFQTYMSGRYEIGPHEIGWRTNVQDMAPVWDGHRGDGILIGVFGTVDNLHPDLRANYEKRYLKHHDPQDGIGGSSPLGTAMAGVIAADDNGRGLVGMAPDSTVFAYTGHRREKPDIVVFTSQLLPYGEDRDASFFRDEDARGGLGRIVVANLPGEDQTNLIYRLDDDEDPLHGFDDPDGGADAHSLFPSRVDEVSGWLNSQYAYHGDRHVITVTDASMYGHKVAFTGAEGPMTLVSAPQGTSAYWGIYDPGSQFDPTLPDYDPGFADWNVSGDAVQTLVLDHSGDAGFQQKGETIGVNWSLLAELMLDVGIDRPQDYTDAHGGGFGSSVVGGAVALMLDANPNLGWRDVQAILAYSADPVRVGTIPYIDTWDSHDFDVHWQEESNWNGGGLMHSAEFGFGALDTRGAVRLAETWGEWGERARTTRNELDVVARLEPGQKLKHEAVYSLWPDERVMIDPFALEFEVPKGIEIEHVVLDIEFSGRPNSPSDDVAGMVGFQIISPEGQRSIVAAQARYGDVPGTDESVHELDREFTTRAFWGQTAEAGETWRVVVLPGDALGRNAFSSDLAELEIENAVLRFHGAREDRNDVYVYTDALITMMTNDANTADASFDGSIADATGHGAAIRDGRGKDAINASAMTYDLVLDSEGGGRGIARGGDLDGPVRLYRLAGDTDMRGLISGDGDDVLRGGSGAQRLEAGRGRDRLEGGGGRDELHGGAGRDLLRGQGGGDRLLGEDGSDRLFGAAGGDRLYGGGGRDRLDGGGGRDKLFGGGGSDAFVFGRGDGRDRVMDFKDGRDTILLDGDLMGRDAQGTVIRLAETRGDDVVLDFGRGDVLVIEDATIGQLRGDLDFF